MVHAYLVHHDMTRLQTSTLGELFLSMMNFYGNEFNPKETGINFVSYNER
jgi:hypothetical protein